FDHALALGAMGSTGTTAANRFAHEADVVIGVGTRYSDFTTASRTAFQNPGVRFVILNVTAADTAKLAATMLEADARAGLIALRDSLAGWSTPASYRGRAPAVAAAWDAHVQRALTLSR